MCGIAGIAGDAVGRNYNHETLSRMVALLHHRGPDGQGSYHDERVLLGHARLSIIDLEGGAQPIHNEDKSVWVVFNGEIFNYIELRRDLEARGHKFYTHSDTEVIVHLYEEYGDTFASYLNGQFAIALWDKRRQRLVMLRDRPGILPFFYTIRGGTLVFASEAKSVLSALGETPGLDHEGLDQLFTFWSPVSPRTLFRGINELPPGHLGIFEKGKLTVRRYWEWDFPEHGAYAQGTEQDFAEQLHELLIDATRIRLRSDVPVGAYLSGGLDSSILVSLIHHYGNVPLRTFSIGFEDKGLDESSFQKTLIDHLEADHSSIQCRHDDIAAGFEDAIWHTESAILRTAPIPMGMLSGLVRQQDYKVVLTGEGADEVFGGYDIFKEAKIRRFWAQNPDSAFRSLLLKKLYPYLDLSGGRGQAYVKSFFGAGLDNPGVPYFSHIPRWDTTAKIKAFYSDDMQASLRENPVDVLTESLPDSLSHWHPFNRSQYIEAKSLMGGYLLCSQGDRMLMKNSVEGRFPFLDHRVIEFANQLPPKLKMKVLNEKYILKQAMKRYLPDSILARYKQPYRAPGIPSFFSGQTPEYVEDVLSESALRNAGYFDPTRVGMLVKKIKRGRAIGYKDNMALVGILSTQVWHRQFVENFQDTVNKIPNTPIESANKIVAEV